MTALNPPTISEKLAFAFMPERAEAFSQLCVEQRDHVQQLIEATEGTVPILLQQQLEVWALFLRGTQALIELRTSTYLLSGATLSSAHLLTKDVTALFGATTLAPGLSAVKLAHGLLEKSYRLRTHPEEAGQILNASSTITIHENGLSYRNAHLYLI
jgi:hypothetical protein